MAAIVSIISRRVLRIDAQYRNQPNKSKLALYRLLITVVRKLTRRSALVIKVGLRYVGVCIPRHSKEERFGLPHSAKF